MPSAASGSTRPITPPRLAPARPGDATSRLGQGRRVGERRQQASAPPRRRAPGAAPRPRPAPAPAARPRSARAAPPPSRSTRTPLAAATRPRSRTSPSETSTMACAPAAAARGPGPPRGHRGPVVAHQGAHGERPLAERRRAGRRDRHPAPARGRGRARRARRARALRRTSRACRRPRRRRPARAPERSTGARPRRSPSAVTETTSTPGGADDRSPPDDRRPGLLGAARRGRARGRPPTPPRGRGRRRAMTSSAVGTAPMAATSARFCAATLRPTSCGGGPLVAPVAAPHHRVGRGDHRPRARRTTAASSPGPTGTERHAGGRAAAVHGKTRASSSPSLTSRSRTGPTLPRRRGPPAR